VAGDAAMGGNPAVSRCPLDLIITIFGLTIWAVFLSFPIIFHALCPISFQRRIIAFTVCSPIYFLLRATVPMVDPEHFSPPWLMCSSLLFPLGFLFYMGDDVSLRPSLGLKMSTPKTVYRF